MIADLVAAAVLAADLVAAAVFFCSGSDGSFCAYTLGSGGSCCGGTRRSVSPVVILILFSSQEKMHSAAECAALNILQERVFCN